MSILVVALLCAACGSTQAPSPNQVSNSNPARTSNQATSSSQQPASPKAKIRTAAELEASFGTQVHLVGTYKMKSIYGKDRKLMETWPVIVLDDGTEVMLGSFWDRERPNTSSKLLGRRVRASGRLHPEPPNSPGPQNLSFATLHPVDSLELPDAR